MKKIKTLLLMFSLATLAACSSEESDLKDFMKCGIAADHLGRKTAEKLITEKANKYAEEHNTNTSARYLAYIANEAREDLNLYEKTEIAKLYILVKVYNSSTCQDLHNQDSIKMPFLYYLLYIFM